jgi:hypothetical protein
MYLSLLEYYLKKAMKAGPVWHAIYGLIISLLGIIIITIKPVYFLPELLSDMVPGLSGIVIAAKSIIPEWMNNLSGCSMIFFGAIYSIYWFYEWYKIPRSKKI